MICNKSWCAPMPIEHRLNIERHNALVVILGDSNIVADVGCLLDVMSPSMLLCW